MNALDLSEVMATVGQVGIIEGLLPVNDARRRIAKDRGAEEGLAEAGTAGGGGQQIPPEMVEPPEAMGDAAVLLAAQTPAGITGTVQRSEDLLAAHPHG